MTREIDFDDGNEGLTSPTDELLTGPSTSTASECHNRWLKEIQTNKNSYKLGHLNLWLTCNLSLSYPYVSWQMANENTQTHYQEEVFVLILHQILVTNLQRIV